MRSQARLVVTSQTREIVGAAGDQEDLEHILVLFRQVSLARVDRLVSSIHSRSLSLCGPLDCLEHFAPN